MYIVSSLLFHTMYTLSMLVLYIFIKKHEIIKIVLFQSPKLEKEPLEHWVKNQGHSDYWKQLVFGRNSVVLFSRYLSKCYLNCT